MRIKVIVPFALADEHVRIRRSTIPTDVLRPGTEVTFVPCKNSGTSADSAYDTFLMDLGIFEEGLDSEKEGFDAVCIDTVSDSGMEPLRSRLSIPVLAPGHVSMYVAGLLGKRFSIITQWSGWNHVYDKDLRLYELGGRLASVRGIDVPPDIDTLLSGKEEVYPLLERACRRAIDEDGADVLMLGSTTMHQAEAYLRERIEVPVLAAGVWSLKVAEMLVDLGLTQSKRAHPAPARDRDELVHRRLQDVLPAGEHGMPREPIRARPRGKAFRIKCIVPATRDEEGARLRAQQAGEELLLPGTKVDFVPVKEGSDSSDSPYDAFLTEAFVFEEGLAAEREGYDAVVLDSTADPALAPLRSRLRIPVVGPGQTAFHVAAMLGERFSVLAPHPGWAELFRKNLKLYGLARKLASVRDVGGALDGLRPLEDGREIARRLEEPARRAIEEDGADVLMLGSTMMHPARRHLARALPVPVVDPVQAALRMAETLLELGTSHSKAAFPDPPTAKDDAIFRD